MLLLIWMFVYASRVFCYCFIWDVRMFLNKQVPVNQFNPEISGKLEEEIFQ